MPLPMFLPINEVASGQVFLPGLAPTPGGNAPMFPPGTYPIMGSGEFTGTLYPLADPLPPEPMPLPPEVASVALPDDAFAQGMQQIELPQPEPPLFPEMPPPAGAAMPGAEALSEPLPTSQQGYQRAWPPLPEPTPSVQLMPPDTLSLPDVQLRPPEPMQIAGVPAGTLPEMPGVGGLAPPLPTAAGASLEAVRPAVLPLPAADLATPGMEALPEVGLAAPGALAEAGRPVEGSVESGWDALLSALGSIGEQQKALADFGRDRNDLKAPVPAVNDGKIVWERNWGK